MVPGYLKRLSVAYYLQAFVPQAMPGNSPLSLIQELFRKTPRCTTSLVSLAAIVAVSLWLAARAVASANTFSSSTQYRYRDLSALRHIRIIP